MELILAASETDDILDMRCHSMKYNLIFSGIPEPSNIKEENTEEVVKSFIGRELEKVII
jgi:hypothetical protein